MESASPTAKQEVEHMLQNLPDDATLEDIQYHLIVLQKLKRGMDNVANGRVFTKSEARERLSRWLPS